jgi:UDP-N-acetylmuramoyl-L-alanyl-D-glutamate--2,6-diaminopimelate ligase
MPDLATLLAALDIKPQSPCPAGLAVSAVAEDSRQAGPGVLFVAIEGAAADGHSFLEAAAQSGSPAALVSRQDLKAPAGMALVRVERTREALARIAQHLAGDPSHAMKVVGVTGTNGKTTVTYLLDSIFRAAGLKSGVIGTIAYRWPGHEEVANNTTPSPVTLADRMARMRADGVGAVAMEVSSHAIDQYRAHGIRFAAAGLTNLTQDHLDYHHTMEAYETAKGRLFTEILPENPKGIAVLNIDDDAGRRYLAQVGAEKALTFSLSDPAAGLSLHSITQLREGSRLDVRDPQGQVRKLLTPLYGLFNAQNALAAAALALAAGIEWDAIAAGLEHATPAPGRFEMVRAGQPFPIIVDYAHTPDALEKLLYNARGLATRRLIVVFGAGGDRDPTKRAPMGRAAARLADVVIVTNDNPRTEAPEPIAETIAGGIRERGRSDLEWEILLDRRAAIGKAVALAQPGDAIVIAGKGHEDYQILGKQKTHFDDREEARNAVTTLAG